MRVIQATFFGIVLSCVVFSCPASGVEIQPANDSLSGGLFTFDLVRSDAPAFSSQGFQATMSVSGPGTMASDYDNAVAVVTEADYWLLGNSAGAEFMDNGDNSYTFGDGPGDGIAQPVAAGDILARFAFTWDGTAGWYTFAFPVDDLGNIDAAQSFIMDDFWSELPYQFSPGGYDSDSPDSSFKVYIPEPTAVMLFGLGGAILLRKRKR